MEEKPYYLWGRKYIYSNPEWPFPYSSMEYILPR